MAFAQGQAIYPKMVLYRISSTVFTERMRNMKFKNAVLAIAAACLAAAMFALAGCGATPPKYADSPYVGTWEATTAEAYGISMKVSDILDEFTIILEEDGKVTAKVNGQEGVGEWEESDKGVTILGGVVGSEDLEFTAKDDKLLVEYSSATITFEKQESEEKKE